MRLETWNKIQKRKSLNEKELREVEEYIRNCEKEIHRLQTRILKASDYLYGVEKDIKTVKVEEQGK